MSDFGQTLILSGRNFATIPSLPEESVIEKLDLSHNRLTDFVGMKSYQRLSQLVLDDTKLTSFRGVEEISGIVSFSCQRTPLGNSPNIALMAVIVFGDTLRIVNGQQLPRFVFRQAAAMRPKVIDYIAEGWIITNVSPLRIINPTSRKRKTIYCDSAKKTRPNSRTNLKTRRYNNNNNVVEDEPKSVYSAASSVHQENQQQQDENVQNEVVLQQQQQVDNEVVLKERFKNIHSEFFSSIPPPPVNTRAMSQQYNRTLKQTQETKGRTTRNIVKEKTERPISPLGNRQMPFEEERKRKEIGEIDLPQNWVSFTTKRAQSRAAAESQQSNRNYSGLIDEEQKEEEEEEQLQQNEEKQQQQQQKDNDNENENEKELVLINDDEDEKHQNENSNDAEDSNEQNTQNEPASGSNSEHDQDFDNVNAES